MNPADYFDAVRLSPQAIVRADRVQRAAGYHAADAYLVRVAAESLRVTTPEENLDWAIYQRRPVALRGAFGMDDRRRELRRVRREIEACRAAWAADHGDPWGNP